MKAEAIRDQGKIIRELEKLIALLKDAEPGLMTWHVVYKERLKSIVEKSGYKLEDK